MGFRAFWRLFRPRTALSTAFASLGGAFYAGLPEGKEVLYLFLTLLGVTLAHFAVNALNEYVDYRSGLDFRTRRSPFSGGTKVLVDGLLRPRDALAAFAVTFSIASAAGLYLTYERGLLVLLFSIIGASIMLTYSTLLVKLGLGEVSVMVKGIAVFMGSAYSVHGLLPIEALPVGLSYGTVSAIALYANYVADLEADRSAGRKTLPILLGERAPTGYLAFLLLLAALVIYSVSAGLLSPLALLSLLPAGYLAFTLRDFGRGELESALRNNAVGCRMVDGALTISLLLRASLAL
ncbi:MAG: prenyltransferase [Acidilobaceae archaeon]|nr:prenyltransferase [Acidilobaceae archaeon]